MNTVQYENQSMGEDLHGDLISQLPSDQTQPSYNEIQIVNTLFKEHRHTMNTLFEESQDAVLAGLLFIALTTIPNLDDNIRRFIPATGNSPYFLILFKAIMVACLFWLIKHFYLSRKGS